MKIRSMGSSCHWLGYFTGNPGSVRDMRLALRSHCDKCSLPPDICRKMVPSGNSTQLWKITMFNGKIHYKWQFSIAMLNYQRVPSKPFHRPLQPGFVDFCSLPSRVETAGQVPCLGSSGLRGHLRDDANTGLLQGSAGFFSIFWDHGLPDLDSKIAESGWKTPQQHPKKAFILAMPRVHRLQSGCRNIYNTK